MGGRAGALWVFDDVLFVPCGHVGDEVVGLGANGAVGDLSVPPEELLLWLYQSDYTAGEALTVSDVSFADNAFGRKRSQAYAMELFRGLSDVSHRVRMASNRGSQEVCCNDLDQRIIEALIKASLRS